MNQDPNWYMWVYEGWVGGVGQAMADGNKQTELRTSLVT